MSTVVNRRFHSLRDRPGSMSVMAIFRQLTFQEHACSGRPQDARSADGLVTNPNQRIPCYPDWHEYQQRK
jgi:hypothetical protein